MVAGRSAGYHCNKGRQFRLAVAERLLLMLVKRAEVPKLHVCYCRLHSLIPASLGNHTDRHSACKPNEKLFRLLGYSWC